MIGELTDLIALVPLYSDIDSVEVKIQDIPDAFVNLSQAASVWQCMPISVDACRWGRCKSIKLVQGPPKN